MIDSNFIVSIVSLIVGGGLSVPFTIKFARRKADADAMKAVQEVYQETLNDLRKEKNFQKEEIIELRGQIDVLRKELYKLRNVNIELMKKVNMYDSSK